jgi:hypothetical protein
MFMQTEIGTRRGVNNSEFGSGVVMLTNKRFVMSSIFIFYWRE